MSEVAKAEKRGYAKGYAAGRRRIEKYLCRDRVDVEREKFRQQVFCAALTGTLQRGSWRKGDKAWTSIPDYTTGCWKFADEAVKHTYFRDPESLKAREVE